MFKITTYSDVAIWLLILSSHLLVLISYMYGLKDYLFLLNMNILFNLFAFIRDCTISHLRCFVSFAQCLIFSKYSISGNNIMALKWISYNGLSLWLTKRKIASIFTIQVCFSKKYISVVYGGKLRLRKSFFNIIY